MAYGLDYSFARPNLDVAKAQGYQFVCRYLSWLPNGKVIGLAERDYILSRGLDLALNWEFDARDGLGGSATGNSHGAEAVRQAINLGYPKGSSIIFSYDWDVTEGQQNLVNAHCRAAGLHVRGAGYRMAAYGGYWLIKRLFDAGLIDDGWQAYAWSGGLWDARASVRQIRNGVTVGGGSCDINQSVGPTYFWNHQTTPILSPIPTLSSEDEDMLFAFKEKSNDTVYISDGYRYRTLHDYNALKNLIDAGILRKVGTQYSLVDGTGYVVVIGDGLISEVGGVSVDPVRLQ